MFLSSVIGLPAAASAGVAFSRPATIEKPFYRNVNGLKTSLNAFSFNDPLLNGTMTISDMLDFCAAAGFEGVDITGYYFKGYPLVPPDDYLYQVKRKAFSLGLEISGTGVRNDFTFADSARRQQEIALVKNWIEVAAKIGAPVIRIFAGNQKTDGYTNEQVTQWMLKDIQTCVDYGKQHGVVIGLQNHNDFIQTAAQVNSMIESINSEWLGLILDTGSYRVNDPYEEIALSAKHAVNWQVKEKIFIKGEEKDADLDKLIAIIKSSGYKGYLPIETLGEGDARAKVIALLGKLNKALG